MPVKFLGSINQSSVFSYMRGAIAHICPSRTESGELVNYEAQATGCIAIGSDVDGIPEYISDNKTGLLFKNENTLDLSQKLIIAAENGKSIRKIREFALKKSKSHGWGMFTDSYIDLYNNLSVSHRTKEFDPWSVLTQRLLLQINR